MKKLARLFFRQHDWQALPQLGEWVVGEGIQIQQIPAPTFAEERRAQHVADRFRELGLIEVAIDDQYNVYGLLKGRNREVPALMVSAHTDTVFPAETNLSIKRDGTVIYGPGLGDNSMGVAGLLGLAKWYRDQQLRPGCDVWFTATSCEEGLGNLEGMRKAFARLHSRVGMVINLEGLAFGHVYNAGIAVHRMHITAEADGGHSWLHFGRPTATHGILELGAQILYIPIPKTPRTTINVGMIEGGQAINALARSAGLWLDLRSEDADALENVRQQVQQRIHALEGPELRFQVEVVGDRPAGAVAPNHPLIEAALTTLELLHVRPSLENGSTDGNIPLAAGCPTVTLGITRGGNAHRLDEYIEVEPVLGGMQQLITMATSAAEYLRTEHEKAAGD